MQKAHTATNWTKDEMTKLYNARVHGIPYSVVARSLGRTEESCKTKFNKTDWSAYSDPIQVDNNLDNIEAFKEKAMFSTSKKLNLWRIRADAIADTLEKSIKALPTVPAPVYTPTKGKQSYSPQDVGLILSDLHVGQEHTLKETGGLSEYNLDIFLQRLERLKHGVVEITTRHSLETILPNLHIFCLGDLVAGLNAAGGWSHLHINMSMLDQMTTAAKAITEFIYFLLPLYENIYFYGIGGNHGRAAPVGEQKDMDNWDTVSYRFIEQALKVNPRVHFRISETWWKVESIRNHKFLLVHGDYTKGGAAKGLENFGNKMIGMIGTFNYLLAGHFHNSMEISTNGFKIKGNGSFVGSDVYSLRNVHAFSKPEQKIFGIHDRQGVTWTYDLNLDIPRDTK